MKKLFTKGIGTSFYTILGNTAKWVIISLFFQLVIGFGLALFAEKEIPRFQYLPGADFLSVGSFRIRYWYHVEMDV